MFLTNLIGSDENTNATANEQRRFVKLVKLVLIDY